MSSQESTNTAVQSCDTYYNSRVFALREIRDYTQHLAGSIFTIIDAAITGPQNKALKDLIRKTVWDEHYTAVMNWNDRQIRIELAAVSNYDRRVNAGEKIEGSVPIAPQLWQHVVIEPYTDTDIWNVFPFSRTATAQLPD